MKRIAVWTGLALALGISGGGTAAEQPGGKRRTILVFSKTAGFRHDSIPAAQDAVRAIAKERGWGVLITEDPAWFTPKRLESFDTVVFLLTTGDALDDGQQQAMEGFIRKGGGYVGVHAASDTEYEWAWYGRLVGAYFASHPAVQEATINIEDTKHPSTSFLPNSWKRRDEWYDFKVNPRPNVRVLASLDESTYQNGKMGKDHPIMWCQEIYGGRSWYTGLGHTVESYSEPMFLRMLGEGIEWASQKSRRK
ncbi:MAG: ThuA domain-containing protein [Fimbriimonadaceae bacterium]